MGLFRWLGRLFGFGKTPANVPEEMKAALTNKGLDEDEKFHDEGDVKKPATVKDVKVRAKQTAKRVKKAYTPAVTDKEQIIAMVVHTYYYSNAKATIDEVVEAIKKNHKIEFYKEKDADGAERYVHSFDKDGKTYVMKKMDFNSTNDVWTNFHFQVHKTTEDNDKIGYRKRFIMEVRDFKTNTLKKTIDSYKANPRPGYNIEKDEVLTPEQWEKRREKWYATKGK